ncbi:hypothetical protein HMPREF0653_01430 [Prevotella disiens JCM 6334 = ATCC 29426]|uniref:Uncharacterized protein n=1 Tax=Prevotella disiens JCM 6334 = ATCC 29426 TaxID=1235811 RepID=A0ABN0NS64_9BACT|nr:hypothetical protein HMPREF0653_01430 [Prevotella disiens JCM 6334 = ATCC 29426]
MFDKDIVVFICSKSKKLIKINPLTQQKSCYFMHSFSFFLLSLC